MKVYVKYLCALSVGVLRTVVLDLDEIRAVSRGSAGF
jgi:hypothetical protein